jgi:hypothetical protein
MSEKTLLIIVVVAIAYLYLSRQQPSAGPRELPLGETGAPINTIDWIIQNQAPSIQVGT